MRKCLFLVLLTFIGSHLFAQTLIQGTVIDKDSNKPIADVIVQYGATSRDYVNTDTKG